MSLCGSRIEELTEGDKGYIAGILDGEGSIGFRKVKSGSNWLLPRVTVANTSYNMLRKLINITAVGTICSLSRLTGSGKTVHEWGVYETSDVYLLLKAVTPYLEVKRGRAEVIMEFCELKIMNGLTDPIRTDLCSRINTM